MLLAGDASCAPVLTCIVRSRLGLHDTLPGWKGRHPGVGASYPARWGSGIMSFVLFRRLAGRSSSAMAATAAGLALCATGIAAEESGTAGSGDPPARIELVAAGTTRAGRLRIEALVTTPAIRRVDFLLDGRLVDQDRRFPFGIVLEPPAAPPRGRLEAVALDGDGSELARDSLPLHSDPSTMEVAVSEIRELDGAGWLEIVAEVTHPEGVAIERVDFYRDERYVASVGASPYRTRIARSDGGFVRVVALTSTDALAETVHLLDHPGGSDTVSVSLVELYAMVTTRSGSPVAGLGPESFELLQGDRHRVIETFSEGDAAPLSLALVIDRSGSMYDNLDRAKRSARKFLESTLDEGDTALLVDFDSRPRLLQDSTDDLEALISRFDWIRSEGGSAIYDAILFAALQLEGSAGRRRALVVLTDGEDSGSRIGPAHCARAAQRAGVPIFVLGLGHPVAAAPSHRRLALRQLAEATGGGVHPIRRLDDIDAAYRAIDLQLRGQYLLGFTSEAPLSTAELDSLTVRVEDSRLEVRTILGGQIRDGQ